MVPYARFRPTGLDPVGVGLPERQEWFVVPCATNRDACPLDVSNFRVAAKMLDELDPEKVDHEDHTFRHWGSGWFTILIVRPDSPCARAAEEMSSALAHYPVLDDSDFYAACEEVDHA